MHHSPRIFLSPPHQSGGEFAFVRETFRTNYLAPGGPMVEAFEAEFTDFTGIAYCLALDSGTAAMHLALRELGVGAGDLILASSLTFIGSISPVTFLGGELCFIDANRSSWTMDPELLAEKLAACAKAGRLPKAVIPTDLYGQSADLDRILEICRPYGVPVIEDTAEAVGARYKDRHAGKGARATVFSFNGNKIITTAGGGMLASDDPELIRHARFLSNQAREPFPHYEHREIGYNYRMSSLAAAVGRGQFQVLEERVQRKRGIFAFYQEQLGGLPGISFMPEASYGCGNRWLTVITVDETAFGATPEQLRLALEQENIEARPIWKPMHMQPIFAACEAVGGGVSEDLFRRGLCLPSGTALTEADLSRICGIVRRQGNS